MARRVPGWAARRDQQRGRAHLDRLGRQRRRTVEVGERHVERRQQPVVDGTELDHAAVVGAGGADRQLEVAGVLPVAEPTVVERVEDELAGEAEEVEGAGPVVGNERAGGGEVLAEHDLVGLGGPLLVGGEPRHESVEGRVEVMVGRRALQVIGLAEFVATGIAQRVRCGRGPADRRGHATSSASP